MKVVSIVGPTAVGKTDVSIEIAKTFDAEIISGDSMQVYKELDIGTAKVTEEEMQGITHYMIDKITPEEDYNVAQFKEDVQFYINKIHRKGKLPLIVGGSGLYIQSVLYDYQFIDYTKDAKYRNKLKKRADEEGNEKLYKELLKVDPEQAKKIHPNNVKRVIRALEIYRTTGKPMSEHLECQSNTPIYNAKIIGLNMERKLLYERINKRVDEMIKQGLVDEVKGLYEAGLKNHQSMKGIGYKELIPVIEGRKSLESAIDTLKRNTRQFAKRQLTYFKNKLPVDWYDINENNRTEQYKKIKADLAGFLNVK